MLGHLCRNSWAQAEVNIEVEKVRTYAADKYSRLSGIPSPFLEYVWEGGWGESSQLVVELWTEKTLYSYETKPITLPSGNWCFEKICEATYLSKGFWIPGKGAFRVVRFMENSSKKLKLHWTGGRTSQSQTDLRCSNGQLAKYVYMERNNLIFKRHWELSGLVQFVWAGPSPWVSKCSKYEGLVTRSH